MGYIRSLGFGGDSVPRNAGFRGKPAGNAALADENDPETDTKAPDSGHVRECPQSDAVELMRSCAESDVPFVLLCERVAATPLVPSEHSRVLRLLADMVERDYVRQDYVVSTYAAIEKERDRWKADAKVQRNNFEMVQKNSEYYKLRIFGLGDAFGCSEAGVNATLDRILAEWRNLEAERDELKHKLDDSKPISDAQTPETDANPSEGDSVAHSGREAAQRAIVGELRFYAEENRYDYDVCNDAFMVDERLSELCARAADMLEVIPGGESYNLQHESGGASGTNRGSVSDDTREKLEADVREYMRINHPICMEPYTEHVLDWLDRQAAITERVWRGYCNRKLGLQGLSELRAERDYWREQVRTILDYACEHKCNPVYNEHVMDYPRTEGFIAPSTLAASEIDHLRDRNAEVCRELARREHDAAMPKGVEWPRLADGELLTADNAPDDVIVVSLALDGSSYQLQYDFADNDVHCMHEAGEPVEPPDSLDAVKRDLNALVWDKDADECIGVGAGVLQKIVERIGKMAGGKR